MLVHETFDQVCLCIFTSLSELLQYITPTLGIAMANSSHSRYGTIAETGNHEAGQAPSDISEDGDGARKNTRSLVSRLRHIRSFLVAMMTALLPSFLWSPPRMSASSNTGKQISRTSALDGLRGLSCLAVMNFHILWAYHSYTNYGYGLSLVDMATCLQEPNVSAQNHLVLQLPGFRLLYVGTAPVSAFFIVSGFVLSHRPLALAREGHWTELLNNLSSSTFRRGIRLYLPVIAATVLSLLTFLLGWWQYRPLLLYQDPQLTIHFGEPKIKGKLNLAMQIFDWLEDLAGVMDVWNWHEYYGRYDSHLWTIGCEFRASMIVLLLLPVYLFIRSAYRFMFLLVFIIHAYLSQRWEISLFFSGIFLADLSQKHRLQVMNQHNEFTQRLDQSTATLKGRLVVSLTRLCLLCISLYLMSAPDHCLLYTPGYRVLSRLIPSFDASPHRFYPSIGAFLLVGLVSNCPPDRFINRYLLNTRVIQYFGRLSYSIYLVHGPLVHILGYRLFDYMLTLNGSKTISGHTGLFLVTYTIFFAVIVCNSDIFCRVVDEPSIRFARQAKKWVMSSP